jgi:hypothetical protein
MQCSRLTILGAPKIETIGGHEIGVLLLLLLLYVNAPNYEDAWCFSAIPACS